MFIKQIVESTVGTGTSLDRKFLVFKASPCNVAILVVMSAACTYIDSIRVSVQQTPSEHKSCLFRSYSYFLERWSIFERSQSCREIYTKLFTLTPTGTESDSNPAGNGASIPSQAEVTDFNSSDFSTTKTKNRVASFGALPSDTRSGSDSTMHYGVTTILEPTSKANRKKKT